MNGGNNSTGSLLLKIDRAKPKNIAPKPSPNTGRPRLGSSFGSLMLDVDKAVQAKPPQEKKAEILAGAIEKVLEMFSSPYGSRHERQIIAMKMLGDALKQADEIGKP